ncbi:hypothetical protein Tco_0310491, partial [Tanacetum coccineum]
ISGKGTIKTSCLDFEKVSYVEELKFNLLSVSQICDKKHNVLFTDKECLILSLKFKFFDEDLVILRAPRKNDVYSLDLKNIIPSGGVTCLVAKATKDEVFSCRITPLTPPMLEVVTALAAEEAHSTSPHSRDASSPRDAQGTPTQSTAEAQDTADSQGTA